jgi:hypothetical protein
MILIGYNKSTLCRLETSFLMMMPLVSEALLGDYRSLLLHDLIFHLLLTKFVNIFMFLVILIGQLLSASFCLLSSL